MNRRLIGFLFKGLVRDRSRSLIPLITVMGGVACTVILTSYMTGIQDDMIWMQAVYNSGHVKIMTRAYAEEVEQLPNDLALTGVSEWVDTLRTENPQMIWVKRIKFAGLLDIPDCSRESRVQGSLFVLGVELVGDGALDRRLLNLDDALVRGRMPENPGEMLISESMARSLEVAPGDITTLITKTMYGSLANINLTVAGTVHFGLGFMDRGAMIADISDLQVLLDMEDGAGEVFGFFPDLMYRDKKALEITQQFNGKYSTDDEFSPVMLAFSEQWMHGDMLASVKHFSAILISVFVAIMFIVIWNAGLMNGLRRYGEIGMRLAIGEDRNRVYGAMIAESLMIGFFGSLFGTALGLFFSWIMQVKGIDISSMVKNASVLIVDVLRARITPVSLYIGFIPGFFATFFGTAVSGIGIYKRETAMLFRELEE